MRRGCGRRQRRFALCPPKFAVGFSKEEKKILETELKEIQERLNELN